MKKFIMSIILCLSLIVAHSASADLTSTLNFTGFFEYAGDRSIDPIVSICNAGFGGDLCNQQPAQENIVTKSVGGYYGVGALAYNLNLNLPEDREAVYPWWLKVNLSVKGVYEDDSGVDPFEGHLDESGLTLTGSATGIDSSLAAFIASLGSVDLGEFALGANNSDVASFIASIPSSGNIGDLSFLFEGDDTEGLFLFALDENVLDYYDDASLQLAFNGQVELTAHELENSNTVVPEPASMILLGSGLIGGVFVRRKRA